MKEKIITVLLVKPDHHPAVIEIPNTLEEKQEIVGGNIQVFPLADDVAIICNEEGKIDGLELNRPIYHNGKNVEIIAGTFIIAGDDISTGEFVSLTDEQIAEYKEQFFHPVFFIKVDGEIIAVPREGVNKI